MSASNSTGSSTDDLAIDTRTRTAVIEAIIERLAEYAFPEVAKKLQDDLRDRLSQKGYQAIKSGAQLAETLTTQLQHTGKDRQLKVYFSPATLPDLDPKAEIPREELAQQQRLSELRNFDINRIERFSGNIGYLELFSFEPPEFAGDTLAAAMRFLANTSALVIDLRYNRGGSASMVALLTSYLLPAYPAVHLTDLYWPKENRRQQSWTIPHLPAPRYDNKPVYVVTSLETFSAAEEFAYNLQQKKRAVIVGETTAGGANPGVGFRLHDHFWMFVPTGQAISIETGENWESVGVVPDFKVPAELAIKTAQLLAFRRLMRDADEGKTEPLDASLRREIEKSLPKVEASLDRMQQELVSSMSRGR